MINTVYSMASEMRRMRIPVATSDLVSAAGALKIVDLADREVVRESLATCLAKSPQYRDTFDVLFDLYFSESPATEPRSFGSLEDQGLRDVLVTALAHRNRPLLREIATEAVERYAKLQPGRAVAGTYAIFRTMRALDVEVLLRDVESASPAPRLSWGTSRLAHAIQVQHVETAIAEFETIVGSEIRRRLVADRGADNVAATLRNPLPEDADFLSASSAVIEQMNIAIEPLGRRLSHILLDRQRSAISRKLDVRATIRTSLSTGGTPVDLRFLPPNPPKPRLVVIADISGSVASFASFALQLTYAMRSQFSSLRSFVFIDGIDEVSDLLSSSRDITETTRRINRERRGVWLDGHSDYGNALFTFTESHLSAIDNRTTVLVLGDARNNYRDSRSDALHQIRSAAASLYWLNPEPSTLWNEGDSIMGEYAEHCEGVVECRTVRQLEGFIAHLG